MAAGATYTTIATTTVSGTTTQSVTFSSISGSYTDLIVVFNGGTNASGSNVDVTFNNDTGSNYSVTYLNGDGTSATSGRATNQTAIRTNDGGYPSTDYNTVHIFSVMNYSNSTTYKTLLSRANKATGTGAGVSAVVGLWRSTSAITSIKINVGANCFRDGSTLSIYGITAA